MKAITMCIALAVLLFACSKEESNDVSSFSGSEPEMLKAPKPHVTTTSPSLVTSKTATSGGNAASTGAPVTARGICYATTHNPTISNQTISSGSGYGTYTSIISDLPGNSQYYVRAFVVKNSITYYGSEVSLVTLGDYGSVTDIDGNTYNTITIGTQVWTVENLRTTKYRDGTPIPNVADNAAWAGLTTGAYCNYNNDTANAAIYGRLYNWSAATDTHNIAPAGFHLPSQAEWDVLRNYLGGLNVAGSKVKEAGLAHWFSPNTGADNSSGFTALPGGARYYNYSTGGSFFSHLGYNGVWWTSTTSGSNPDNAMFIETNYDDILMYRSSFLGGFGYYDKRTGYSIRLIKD
jgi:uncharacterized protein (TIGR02145 family)